MTQTRYLSWLLCRECRVCNDIRGYQLRRFIIW